MLKKIVRIVLPILVFVGLWLFLQKVLTPKYEGSTPIVDGYYALEKNSIDVLFLGASQMFCSVDAKRLTDEYNIPCYDFGASSQNLSMTYYYLEEALKTQKPKTVMVEICRIYEEDADIEEAEIAWNYAPTHFSFEKCKSLYRLLDGDVKQVISYAIPLLQFHGTWKELKTSDFTYLFADRKHATRGYFARETVSPQEIAYFAEDPGEVRTVTEDSKAAIEDMVALCKKKGIEIIFFKAPVASWTRNDAAATEAYMDANGLEYFDMNTMLEALGIDAETDFFNEEHLNHAGATKTTDYIADYLKNRKK